MPNATVSAKNNILDLLRGFKYSMYMPVKMHTAHAALNTIDKTEGIFIIYSSYLVLWFEMLD